MSDLRSIALSARRALAQSLAVGPRQCPESAREVRECAALYGPLAHVTGLDAGTVGRYVDMACLDAGRDPKMVPYFILDKLAIEAKPTWQDIINEMEK